MHKIDFKTYTGTKTVKAAPMTAKEAKEAGAAITEETVNGNAGKYGYLVEYADGYRSWSPKDVFDQAYRPSGTHAERLNNELADLTDKICKNIKDHFTVGAVPEFQREDLWSQTAAMIEYADKLYDRILQTPMAKERVMTTRDPDETYCHKSPNDDD